MHWLAQCLEPAKWPKGSKEFQHPPRIEPKLPDSLEITLTTEPWVCINLLKKNRIWLVIFWVMDCCSWIAQVEYQGHTLYTRILEANLWSVHLITFNIDWSWNIFILHNFCSMLIKQVIDLKKWELRTWNLGQISKIKWWMVGQQHSKWLYTKANCSKNLKIENWSLSCQRWSLHYMAFKHHISLVTNLAANFDCNRFRIMPDIVPKLLHAAVPPSVVAVLFNLNMTDVLSSGRSLI